MFFRKRKKDRNESDEEVQVDAFINLPTKTTITGDLRAERAVRIDCDFKGNVITTERVVISKEGQVEGNVKCSSALISGRVRKYCGIGISDFESSGSYKRKYFDKKYLYRTGSCY